ncbi:hypothetical protein ACFLTD_04305, partial [Elusimicrobiota bacterium]
SIYDLISSGLDIYIEPVDLDPGRLSLKGPINIEYLRTLDTANIINMLWQSEKIDNARLIIAVENILYRLRRNMGQNDAINRDTEDLLKIIHGKYKGSDLLERQNAALTNIDFTIDDLVDNGLQAVQPDAEFIKSYDHMDTDDLVEKLKRNNRVDRESMKIAMENILYRKIRDLEVDTTLSSADIDERIRSLNLALEYWHWADFRGHYGDAQFTINDLLDNGLKTIPEDTRLTMEYLESLDFTLMVEVLWNSKLIRNGNLSRALSAVISDIQVNWEWQQKWQQTTVSDGKISGNIDKVELWISGPDFIDPDKIPTGEIDLDVKIALHELSKDFNLTLQNLLDKGLYLDLPETSPDTMPEEVPVSYSDKGRAWDELRGLRQDELVKRLFADKKINRENLRESINNAINLGGYPTLEQIEANESIKWWLKSEYYLKDDTIPELKMQILSRTNLGITIQRLVSNGLKLPQEYLKSDPVNELVEGLGELSALNIGKLKDWGFLTEIAEHAKGNTGLVYKIIARLAIGTGDKYYDAFSGNSGVTVGMFERAKGITTGAQSGQDSIFEEAGIFDDRSDSVDSDAGFDKFDDELVKPLIKRIFRRGDRASGEEGKDAADLIKEFLKRFYPYMEDSMITMSRFYEFIESPGAKDLVDIVVLRDLFEKQASTGDMIDSLNNLVNIVRTKNIPQYADPEFLLNLKRSAGLNFSNALSHLVELLQVPEIEELADPETLKLVALYSDHQAGTVFKNLRELLSKEYIKTFIGPADIIELAMLSGKRSYWNFAIIDILAYDMHKYTVNEAEGYDDYIRKIGQVGDPDSFFIRIPEEWREEAYEPYQKASRITMAKMKELLNAINEAEGISRMEIYDAINGLRKKLLDYDNPPDLTNIDLLIAIMKNSEHNINTALRALEKVAGIRHLYDLKDVEFLKYVAENAGKTAAFVYDHFARWDGEDFIDDTKKIVDLDLFRTVIKNAGARSGGALDKLYELSGLPRELKNRDGIENGAEVFLDKKFLMKIADNSKDKVNEAYTELDKLIINPKLYLLINDELMLKYLNQRYPDAIDKYSKISDVSDVIDEESGQTLSRTRFLLSDLKHLLEVIAENSGTNTWSAYESLASLLDSGIIDKKWMNMRFLEKLAKVSEEDTHEANTALVYLSNLPDKKDNLKEDILTEIMGIAEKDTWHAYRLLFEGRLEELYELFTTIKDHAGKSSGETYAQIEDYFRVVKVFNKNFTDIIFLNDVVKAAGEASPLAIKLLIELVEHGFVVRNDKDKIIEFFSALKDKLSKHLVLVKTTSLSGGPGAPMAVVNMQQADKAILEKIVKGSEIIADKISNRWPEEQGTQEIEDLKKEIVDIEFITEVINKKENHQFEIIDQLLGWFTDDVIIEKAARYPVMEFLKMVILETKDLGIPKTKDDSKEKSVLEDLKDILMALSHTTTPVDTREEMSKILLAEYRAELREAIRLAQRKDINVNVSDLLKSILYVSSKNQYEYRRPLEALNGLRRRGLLRRKKENSYVLLLPENIRAKYRNKIKTDDDIDRLYESVDEFNYKERDYLVYTFLKIRKDTAGSAGLSYKDFEDVILNETEKDKTRLVNEFIAKNILGRETMLSEDDKKMVIKFSLDLDEDMLRLYRQGDLSEEDIVTFREPIRFNIDFSKNYSRYRKEGWMGILGSFVLTARTVYGRLITDDKVREKFLGILEKNIRDMEGLYGAAEAHKGWKKEYDLKKAIESIFEYGTYGSIFNAPENNEVELEKKVFSL